MGKRKQPVEERARTLRCINDPDERIDVTLIPEYVRMNFLRSMHEIAKRKFQDPEYRAKYEAWKAEEDAKKAAQAAAAEVRS